MHLILAKLSPLTRAPCLGPTKKEGAEFACFSLFLVVFEHVALFPLALRFFWGVVPPRQKINIKRGALRHARAHMRFALLRLRGSTRTRGFRVLLWIVDCGVGPTVRESPTGTVVSSQVF